MHALPIIIAVVCFFAIAYRYYSAFIAAKVLALDDARVTPAHRLNDGHNYFPTNKWVLFGHHFAAISGAGPLIGPVLAAQFGFLPGLLWLVIGVVIGGAVHDFVILAASIRHDGKSLAEIARAEMSPLAGNVAAIAVLFVIVIALAGMGLAVVNALKESPWGVFTIGTTIPIALCMGLYMYVWRKGRVREATIIGVIALAAAGIFGRAIPGSVFAPYFTLTRNEVIVAIAAYGFVASVLPVWMLLCPRDYLSSFMKIGTIVLLAAAIVFVNPVLQMPAFSEFVGGGGPIIPGKLFPFVFITVACGAISGFHSLVNSGTTPKMIGRESHARMIGYGAMLIESFVGVTALIATAALYPADYFAINVTPEKFAALGMAVQHLPDLSAAVGENVAGRPGGAVSLAIGVAQIFSGMPGMRQLMAYWYHFAIMFEALFVLTVIDTGTRIGRFLLQEVAEKIHPRWGRKDWIPGTIVTTLLITLAWSGFVWAGTVQTIWPMFGTANQLLAAVALTVGTSYIINSGRAQYAWVTLLPLSFVATTTLYAAWKNITDNFWPLAHGSGGAASVVQGYLNIALTLLIMTCAVLIVSDGVRRWMVRGRKKNASSS